MLKLGDKNISKLYLGDKAISKAYLGDKLVYQAGNPIFLDYIITDGNSYIDTEYCPNENTYIEYDFEVITRVTVSYAGLFGCRENSNAYPYNVFAQSNQFRLDFGMYSEGANYKYEVDTRYLMKAGLGEIYINGELVKSYTPRIKQVQYSMYLGNFNADGVPYTTGVAQNIYGFKVYENNVQLHDFKPCIAPNGQVAMYDEVNKKYHYNQGTGELKAGGRFVTSILFDGACVIDTGIAHQTCDVECDIRFAETGTRQLMGFGSGTGQFWGAGATGIFDYMANTNALDRTLVTINANATDITITTNADGATRTGSKGSTLSSLKYRIGACPTGSSSNGYWCTCEIWSNKIIGEDGTVIQDLKPYVDENGVACFKDLVTGGLFYNSGTGTLGYTE